MIRFKPNPLLDKLDKIMSFDLVANSPAIFSSFLNQMSRASTGLAVLATPYVLWLLIRLKKFGWIIFFAIFVGGPTYGTYFFLRETDYVFIYYYVALLFLAVYHSLLKITYNDWREPLFVDRNRAG